MRIGLSDIGPRRMLSSFCVDTCASDVALIPELMHSFPNPIRAQHVLTLAAQLRARPFMQGAARLLIQQGFDPGEPAAIWQRVMRAPVALPVSSLAGLNLIYDGDVLWIARDGRVVGGLRTDGRYLKVNDDWMIVAVQEALNDGDWSYARNEEPDGGFTEFLFDRRLDPEEQVNLIRREEQEAARLRSLLDEHSRKPARDSVRSQDVRIDPSIARRLRAMGYLE